MTDTPTTPTATPTPITGNTTPNKATPTKGGDANQIILLDNGRTVQLNAPLDKGQEAVVLAKGVEKVIANFDADKAEISMKDGNLVFTFENGSQTVIEQFELADPMPQIVLQDGTIVAGDVVVAQLEADGVEALDLETAAGGARSGGGSTYSDDLGDVIGMLSATGPNGTLTDGLGSAGAGAFAAPDRDLAGFVINPTPIVGPAGAGNLSANESGLGTTFNGTLNINFGSDGIGNIEGSSFSSSGVLLTSGGESISISYNSTTNTFTATTASGGVVFTLVLNQDGTYTFTQLMPLDHAGINNPNDLINLRFGIVATDGSGDSVNATIVVTIRDAVPTAMNSTVDVDAHTDLGTAFVGDLNFDFGADGAGSVALTGNMTVGDGAVLTSNGQQIHLVYDETTGTYTGMISMTGHGDVPTVMVPVFTLVLNPDGTYSFTQHLPIDGNGPINLGFGFTVTDGDGDTATGVINISITPDSVPVIGTEGTTSTVDETTGINESVNGAVNVNFGVDGIGSVNATGAFSVMGYDGAPLTVNGGTPVTVVFDPATGTYTAFAGNSEEMVFTMVINADGTYTFTLYSSIDHPDGMDPNDALTLVFGYTATDSDGDSANGTINIVVRDDAPVAVDDNATANYNNAGPITGNIFGNDSFGNDGPGSAPAATDPNGVVGPTVPMTGPLVSVTFNGTVYNMPEKGALVINGQYGTLTINADGSYSYDLYRNVARPPEGAQDVFSYTIIDRDGDTSTANLVINVATHNGQGQPTIGDGGTTTTIDESIAFNEPGTAAPPWAHSFVGGTVNVNFGPDGQGTVAGNGNFTNPNGVALTSHGEPIVVTYDAATGVYTGTTAYGGETVFWLQVNADGTYIFRLTGTLDHPDGTNPDDALNLQFGFIATDADGDAVAGTINIVVRDDGPVAVNDVASVNVEDRLPLTGNLLDNDNFGADGRSEGHGDVVVSGQSGAVSSVTVNGVTYEIPSVIPRGHEGPTPITINGQYGTLTIDCNGNYSYQPFPNANIPAGAQDVFTYTIRDGDGDSSSANLIINVGSGDTGTPGENPIDNDVIAVDETTLVGGKVFEGDLNVNFGPDGAGRAYLDIGNVQPASGTLTSGGLPVFYSYIKTMPPTLQAFVQGADGKIKLVFELHVNTDGTYRFEMFQGIDHADPNNPNDILPITFGVVVQDADGDRVIDNFTINVADDAPIAVNDFGTSHFTQKQPLEGNLVANDDFGADGASHGTLVTTVTFNGVVYDMPAIMGDKSMGGQAIPSVTIVGQYGTLTVYADGRYTYTTDGSGRGGQEVFSYTITDGDGDSSTANLTITVEGAPDGTPGNNPIVNDVVAVDETNISTSKPINGDLHINFGPDGAGRAYLDIGNVQPASGTLTSGGLPVTYSYIKTMPPTLQAFVTDAKGNMTLVFELHVNTDGTYRFQMFQGIDHADPNNPNDILPITFGVVVEDADGDRVTDTFTINVADDAPVAVNDVATSHFTQKAPLTGNLLANDNLGLDGAHHAQQNQNEIMISEHVLYTGPMPVVAVTFNGVTYEMPDRMMMGDKSMGGQQTVPSVTIMGQYGTLTVYADGNYTYVRHEGMSVPAGAQDVFSYTIQDGDGDRSTAALTINVESNIVDLGNPTIAPNGDSNGGQGTWLINENGQNDFTGRMDFDYGPDGQGATGGIAGSGVYQTTTWFGTTPLPLTSGGLPVIVTYNASTSTYTAMAGNTLVFTLKVNNDGTYDFSLVGSIDHHNNPTPGRDILCLNFGIRITDADGDTATGNLRILLEDGVPVASQTSATVNESDLSDAPFAAIGANGVIDYNFGLDAGDTLRASNSFQAVGMNGAPLTANGSLVTVTLLPNVGQSGSFADMYEGRAADGTLIFTLTIFKANGVYNYQYTQFHDLDHPQGVNALNLQFGYIMTDGDGDTANNVINITVNNAVGNGNAPIVGSTVGDVNEADMAQNFGYVIERGAVNVDFGVDGRGALVANQFSVQGLNGAPLTIDGQPVTISYYTYPSGLSMCMGGYGPNMTLAFIIYLNPDNTYQFELYEDLDHPAGVNSLQLMFGYAATDTDGDVTNGTVAITVHDGQVGQGNHGVIENEEVLTPITIAQPFDAEDIHVKPIDHDEHTTPIFDEHVLDVLPQPEPVFAVMDEAKVALDVINPAIEFDNIIHIDYSYEKGDVIDLSELIDVAELTEGGKALEAFVNYDPNDGILTVDSTGTGNFTAEDTTRLDIIGFDGGKVKLAIEDMVVDTEFK